MNVTVIFSATQDANSYSSIYPHCPSTGLHYLMPKWPPILPDIPRLPIPIHYHLLNAQSLIKTPYFLKVLCKGDKINYFRNCKALHKEYLILLSSWLGEGNYFWQSKSNPVSCSENLLSTQIPHDWRIIKQRTFHNSKKMFKALISPK